MRGAGYCGIGAVGTVRDVIDSKVQGVGGGWHE